MPKKVIVGKEAILYATVQLLARNSVDGVSILDVANECGLAKASIYHYFSGKEELMMSACDWLSDKIIDSLKRALWNPKVHVWMEEYFIEDVSALLPFSAFMSYALKNEEMRVRLYEHFEGMAYHLGLTAEYLSTFYASCIAIHLFDFCKDELLIDIESIAVNAMDKFNSRKEAA